MKFRKKPVVVEAIQFLDTPERVAELKEFCGSMFTLLDRVSGIHGSSRREAKIETLEDGSGAHQVDHIATEGDWIIRGISGEFYPCKLDIFEATYEPA